MMRWFEEIHDHILGRLPVFMMDAGFHSVEETAHYHTVPVSRGKMIDSALWNILNLDFSGRDLQKFPATETMTQDL